MTVKQLAEELKTSEENILSWGSEFNLNDSRIENGDVPRSIENFIRTRHLQTTHSSVFKLLDSVIPASEINYIYERWIAVTRQKIREGR